MRAKFLSSMFVFSFGLSISFAFSYASPMHAGASSGDSYDWSEVKPGDKVLRWGERWTFTRLERGEKENEGFVIIETGRAKLKRDGKTVPPAVAMDPRRKLIGQHVHFYNTRADDGGSICCCSHRTESWTGILNQVYADGTVFVSKNKREQQGTFNLLHPSVSEFQGFKIGDRVIAPYESASCRAFIQRLYTSGFADIAYLQEDEERSLGQRFISIAQLKSDDARETKTLLPSDWLNVQTGDLVLSKMKVWRFVHYEGSGLIAVEDPLRDERDERKARQLISLADAVPSIGGSDPAGGFLGKRAFYRDNSYDFVGTIEAAFAVGAGFVAAFPTKTYQGTYYLPIPFKDIKFEVETHKGFRKGQEVEVPRPGGGLSWIVSIASLFPDGAEVYNGKNRWFVRYSAMKAKRAAATKTVVR
jgi:hypothetical protein